MADIDNNIDNEKVEEKEKVIIVYKHYKSKALGAAQKRYVERHPEKINEIQRNYYQKNKDKITKRRRELRALKKLEKQQCENKQIDDEKKDIKN